MNRRPVFLTPDDIDVHVKCLATGELSLHLQRLNPKERNGRRPIFGFRIGPTIEKDERGQLHEGLERDRRWKHETRTRRRKTVLIASGPLHPHAVTSWHQYQDPIHEEHRRPVRENGEDVIRLELDRTAID